MPLFSMARKDKATVDKDKPLPAPDVADDASDEERGAPTTRPGTSGTELLLVSKTREASANFKRAQEAEQAYKSKKRAAGAKQQRKNIKVHFKQSAHHFKEGVKAIYLSLAAMPAIFKANRHERKTKADAKKRERDIAKRKQLDERLRQKHLSQAEEEAGEKSKE
jgi:hypothetical protein